MYERISILCASVPCLYVRGNCPELIKDIERAMKYLEDELSRRVLEQLKGMSDEEFTGLALVVAE